MHRKKYYREKILWIILSGAIYAILPIFWKLSTSLMIDLHPQVEHAMPTRELLLSIGRVIGIAIVTTGLLTHHQSLPIATLGCVFLSFPIILYYRQQVAQTHSYL